MDRLLIADDEADIVTMLTSFFEGKGYNVMTASDGIETLKQVEKRPDLILLDISMPGLNGLEYNHYNFVGKNITVIGRSKIVGKPLVNMLIDKGATVTCCNSHTSCLDKYTLNSELVISAIGKARLLCCELPSNAIVIDVGINRDINGKLCGDINSEYVSNNIKNTYVTPVPGGVGLLTRLSLLENVIEAYRKQEQI